MARKRPPAKIRVGLTGESPTNHFRRRMHQYSDLRGGLSLARRTTDVMLFPSIVGYLGRQAAYRNALVPTKFPKKLEDYQKWNRLERISSNGEILWTAAVLGLYAEPLRKYVALRSSFLEELVEGRVEAASLLLDRIEDEFGVSRWLLGQRFYVLQELSGLQAQKDFLEQVMSSERLNEIIAWTAYYYSLRVEHSISDATLEAEASMFPPKGEVNEYFKCTVLSYQAASISDTGAPVSWDEPHCLVDRFETCAAMLLVALATSEANQVPAELISALEQLQGIGDARLEGALAAVKRDGTPLDRSIVEIADQYAIGKYESVIANDYSPLEMIARSFALTEQQPDKNVTQTLRGQALQCVYDILTLSADVAGARQRLRKIAMLTNGHRLSYEIVGFLEHPYDSPFGRDYTLVERFSALGSPIANPDNAEIIDRVSRQDGWLGYLIDQNPESPALQLVASLSGSTKAIEPAIEVLPKHRQREYAAHRALLLGDYQKAISIYRSEARSENRYCRDSARRYLYRVLLSTESYREAVDLLVDHVLEVPGAAAAYELESIAKLCLEVKELGSSISLAIVMHLASRQENPKLERDLSDIYENVASSRGVKMPSDIASAFEEVEINRIIYFLRYVCVPRILDDSTEFDSVDQIEAERIKVLQHLLKVDPAGSDAYLSEIRSITLEGKVTELLQKVQTSKIYVDEVGVKQAVESTLRESFARYQQLQGSPELSYQAEKLSRRLAEILSAKGHPEFRGLKLPASEGESLFSQMLLSVVSEFALNPAYGLDTHVSTTIRHGSFEGHLRSPLASEDLLVSKRGNDHQLSQIWERRLAELNSGAREAIGRALVKFTLKFEEIVASYLKEKLHIRVVGANSAMFNFEAKAEQNNALMEEITGGVTYDSFIDGLIAHCWAMTDLSLEAIRNDLLGPTSLEVDKAFESLVRAITSAAPRENVVILLDAIARARTNFEGALGDVAQWFYKPTDLSRDPFELEVAVHVALKQIENCYVRSGVSPELNINVARKLEGAQLDGLCEILFILVQNAILHSGYEGAPPIRLSSWLDSGDRLHIECINALEPSIDALDRALSASEAEENYERDSALRMARKEGGSGLSKVWRIAEFELKADHQINVEVSDTNFRVDLSLGGVNFL